jgi:nucleoside-diphosphate-sugar epimerase
VKILVTGGTGFIGSHTTVALARDGHAVRLLVRSEEKAKRVFEDLEADLPECVTGDVTDASSVAAALDGCDGVLHAAALVALDAKRAADVVRINTTGARNVVGQAVERGLAHVVYVSSTAALFDPGTGTIGPHSEPTGLTRSAYARSKAETEHWIRALQDQGAPVAATYPGAVLGPHAPELTEFHRSLSVQLRVGLLTEGGINLVDVRDLAAIHAALFGRSPGPGRWLAGGTFASFPDLADLFAHVTDREIPRVRVPGALLRGLGHVGDWAKRVLPFDFPLSYEAMTTATRWPGVDSSQTLLDLDVSFRELSETLEDTLVWMHRAGHLSGHQVGRLARRGAD